MGATKNRRPIVAVETPEAPVKVDPIAPTLPIANQPAEPPADGHKNQEPLAVPATKNPAQVAAEQWNLRDSFLTFYAQRPMADGAAWIEPDKAAIKARVTALITSEDGDPTDMDAVIDAASRVKAQIDTERAAYEAQKGNQRPTDLMWLWAARERVTDLLGAVDAMLTDNGAKLKTAKTPKNKAEQAADATESAGKKTRTTKIDWKARVPEMRAFQAQHGLSDFILRDTQANGYKGEFHVTRLCDDGQWERCEYDPKSHAITPLGEKVSSPLYFDAPGWSVTGSMFGILMLGSDGKIVEVEGINEVVGKGEKATVKPFMKFETYCEMEGWIKNS